jgi:hypothetical protein
MAADLQESLLSDSTIRLFGREMKDIQLADLAKRQEAYGFPPAGPQGAKKAAMALQGDLKRRSANRLLGNQLLAADARIARIYLFSFQNEIFNLVKPALFVVNGEGVPIKVDGNLASATGVGELSGYLGTDLNVWAYDRDDLSIRLDIMTGTFDRILLDYEIGDEGLHGYVRGGNEFGRPQPAGRRGVRGRGRRWRSDDE